MQLLDWSCLSIPKCPDNIVAEVLGADLSLRLYERYVHGCLSHNIVPLPLDRIQGDIQPLLSHLRFQTRFRRPDLVAVINRFHARSRLAPSSAILNIGLGKPTSLLIILLGEAPPFSCITQKLVLHSKVLWNMILTRLMNCCYNIMPVSLANMQRVKPSWASERLQLNISTPYIDMLLGPQKPARGQPKQASEQEELNTFLD